MGRKKKNVAIVVVEKTVDTDVIKEWLLESAKVVVKGEFARFNGPSNPPYPTKVVEKNVEMRRNCWKKGSEYRKESNIDPFEPYDDNAYPIMCIEKGV